MACWCDGKTAGHVLRDYEKRKPGRPTSDVYIEAEHCPKCGRDLRLPVAKVVPRTEVGKVVEGALYYYDYGFGWAGPAEVPV